MIEYRNSFVVNRLYKTGSLVVSPEGTIRYVTRNTVYGHRLVGPAVIFSDGSLMYKVNGDLHRTTGPACIGEGWGPSYYIRGDQLSVEEFFSQYGVL